MFGIFKRETTTWRRRFALLPMEITHGPGKGRDIWLRWYYARSRRSMGAWVIDRARDPLD